MVNHIDKVENIEHDWKKLADRFDFYPCLVHRNESKQRKRAFPDYKLYYTEELANIVYRRYQKDFELLGYKNSYYELLNFIKRNPKSERRANCAPI